MRPNFDFPKDYCYFHTSNTFRPNFNEFHQIFPKSLLAPLESVFQDAGRPCRPVSFPAQCERSGCDVQRPHHPIISRAVISREGESVPARLQRNGASAPRARLWCAGISGTRCRRLEKLNIGTCASQARRLFQPRAGGFRARTRCQERGGVQRTYPLAPLNEPWPI
jgi:hypothetical protein